MFILSDMFHQKDLMGEKEYRELDYPYNAEALMKYIIVPEAEESGFKPSVEKISGIGFDGIDEDLILINDEVYLIDSREEFSQTIKLDKPLPKDKVLMLRFNVDNTMRGYRKDVKISINGIKNKLTSPDWKYYNNNSSFEYTLTTNGEEKLDEINFEFSKGKYKINSLEAYFMDLPTAGTELSEIKMKDNSFKGDNVMSGTVSCDEDGWFNLSVPYDKGFNVTVDGENREYQAVDTAFIGFPLEKGEHEIEITFKAPMLREGKVLSIAGFILIIALGVFDLIKSRNNRRKQET